METLNSLAYPLDFQIPPSVDAESVTERSLRGSEPVPSLRAALWGCHGSRAGGPPALLFLTRPSTDAGPASPCGRRWNKSFFVNVSFKFM